MTSEQITWNDSNLDVFFMAVKAKETVKSALWQNEEENMIFFKSGIF